MRNKAHDNNEPEINWKALYDTLIERYVSLEKNFAEKSGSAQRTLESEVTVVRKRLIGKICLVADHIEYLKKSAEAGHDPKTIVEGIALIQRELESFFSSEQVEWISAEAGTVFDPNLHEAFSMEPSDDVPNGNITREIRIGYKMGAMLLRPSRVVVSSGKPQS
ncbi:MAG: nucleotide exchange factor GrpE [Fibrobacterota bacterium]